MTRLLSPAAAAWLLAAPAVFAADTATAAKRDDSASEKLGIKLSLQCWTFNKLSFFETVDKAAAMGVKYLEMYPGQKLKPGSNDKISLPMSDSVMAEVQKKLSDAGGLKVIAFGVDGVPADEKGARKKFEAAKSLGITVLVTESKPTEVHDKLAKEFGIRYALHNHPKTWAPDDVLAATKNYGPLLGSCSDIGHWMRAKLVPIETIRKMEGRVEHSHFKDLNEFGNGHDVVWGTGKGDPKGVLMELQRQGYKGYLSIEFEHGSLDDLAKTVPACVAFFDKTMAELAK